MDEATRRLLDQAAAKDPTKERRRIRFTVEVEADEAFRAVSHPAARRYRCLSRLLRAAGYLSAAEVAFTFKIELSEAEALLAAYWRANPDEAERERARLTNKARGGWY